MQLTPVVSADREPWRPDAPAWPYALLSRIDEGILLCDHVTDAHGMPRICHAAGAIEAQTAWTSAALAGRSLSVLFGALTATPAITRLQHAIALKQPVRAELGLVTRDHHEFWADLELVPLDGAAVGPAHWLVILRDLTERRRLEAQLAHARLEALFGRLAAATAQELERAIEQISLHAARLAHDEGAVQGNVHTLHQMVDDAAMAVTLTRQLMVSHRRARGHPVAFDPNLVVLEIAILLRRLRTQGPGVQTVLEEPLPMVRADPTLLEQALLTIGSAAHGTVSSPSPVVLETTRQTVDGVPMVNAQDVPPGAYVVVRVSVGDAAWRREASPPDPAPLMERAEVLTVQEAVRTARETMRLAGGWCTFGRHTPGLLTACLWLPIAD